MSLPKDPRWGRVVKRVAPRASRSRRRSRFLLRWVRSNGGASQVQCVSILRQSIVCHDLPVRCMVTVSWVSKDLLFSQAMCGVIGDHAVNSSQPIDLDIMQSVPSHFRLTLIQFVITSNLTRTTCGEIVYEQVAILILYVVLGHSLELWTSSHKADPSARKGFLCTFHESGPAILLGKSC